MKTFFYALVMMAICFVNLTVNASESKVNATMSTEYRNVWVEGRVHADLSGKNIGVVVIKDDTKEIIHIDQITVKADCGYTYKFKTDRDLTSGYTIKVLYGAEDVSESIITAVQSSGKLDFAAAFDTKEVNKKIVFNTINDKYSDGIDGNIIYAFYDKAGVMVKCEAKPFKMGFGLEDERKFDIPQIPEEAESLKVYIWGALSEMIPISDALLKDCKAQFDTDTLFSVTPQIYEAEEKYQIDGIETFYYQGADYNGNPTKVFAYLGIPENVDGKVPAVVFLHGGGGTAYSYWVKKWNEKGYAAIAMDLCGHTPDMQTHDASGPINTEYKDYDTVEFENQWMYQTVVNAIYANNILRSREEIDTDKIGITGISWGGVATSTTIGIDNRFAFAIPIYGCGYLYESSPRWVNLVENVKTVWDPSLFFEDSTVPVCWVNSDHDEHFSLKASTLSYNRVKANGVNTVLSIHPDLNHGHTQPLEVTDIYGFADSIVGNAPGYIKVSRIDTIGNKAYLDIPKGVSISSVSVYTTEDTKLNYQSSAISPLVTVWNTNGTAEISGNVITYDLPDNTGMYYINIQDNYGRTSSTGLINNF